MKMEKHIERILNSDASTELKILKLEVAALRAFASSQNQRMAVAAYKALQASLIHA